MTGGAHGTASAPSGTVRSLSAAETESEGSRLGSGLVPGDVVAIIGELGAGKTVFVRGVCAALGARLPVSSPTFTFVHEYPARACTVYHFDFYRIRNPVELIEIGFAEYLADPRAVCLIEWADRIGDFLPPKRYTVVMKVGADQGSRTIAIDPPGGTARDGSAPHIAGSGR